MSSVVSTVLLVAVVVVLATSVGTVALTLGDGPDEPTPVVSSVTGDLTASGGSATEKSVLLRHEGGDDVDVSEIEIVVEKADGDERGRLVGLPAEEDELEAANIEGDDIFDERDGYLAGSLTLADDDGVWSAGEAMRFRLTGALDPGDRVAVTLVHTESGGVIGRTTLTATDS